MQFYVILYNININKNILYYLYLLTYTGFLRVRAVKENCIGCSPALATKKQNAFKKLEAFCYVYYTK